MGQQSTSVSIVAAQLGDAADTDSIRARMESKILEVDEVVPPGSFVVKGTSDDEVKLPSGAGGIYIGVVFNGGGRVIDQDTGLIGDYGQFNRVTVATERVFYVFSEEAVTYGATVFVRHTAGGGGSQLGVARTDADTASAEAIDAKFHETTTGAGLVKVRLLMAQV